MRSNTFAPLVAALSAYDERLRVVEDGCAALRERVAQQYLRTMTPPPLDFDAELHEQCAAMLQQASICSSGIELQTSPLYGPFVSATGEMPAALLDKGDMTAIRRLIEARQRKTSEASARERQANAALFAAQTAACACSPSLAW